MAGKQRFTAVVDLHLFLIKKDKILLLKRANTGYMDGFYHVPAGHLDGSERLIDGLIREAKEELGIKILEKDAELVHIMHNKSNNERVAFFFEIKDWQGEMRNLELEKHSELNWFDFSNLPDNIVPYAKEAINNYIKKYQLPLKDAFLNQEIEFSFGLEEIKILSSQIEQLGLIPLSAS